MSERWQKYFEDKIKGQSLLKMAYDKWSFNSAAYFYVNDILPKGAKILDIGCGMCFSLIFMESLGYETMGIDNDEEVIKSAQEICRRFHSSTRLEKGDIMNLEKYHDRFDMVMSFGLVEHFDREVTVEIIKNKGKCGTYVLSCIPTKYSSDPITDERLYTLRQFKDIYKDAGLDVVKAFTLGNPAGSDFLRRFVFPEAIFNVFKRTFTYAPAIGIIGKRKG